VNRIKHLQRATKVICVFLFYILLYTNDLQADIPSPHDRVGPQTLKIFLSKSVEQADSFRWYIIRAYHGSLNRFYFEREIKFNANGIAQFQTSANFRFKPLLTPIRRSILTKELDFSTVYEGQNEMKSFINNNNIPLLNLEDGNIVEYDSNQKKFNLTGNSAYIAGKTRLEIEIDEADSIRLDTKNAKIEAQRKRDVQRNVLLILFLFSGVILYFFLKSKSRLGKR